jgi:uncharacterized membrane protein
MMNWKAAFLMATMLAGTAMFGQSALPQGKKGAADHNAAARTPAPPSHSAPVAAKPQSHVTQAKAPAVAKTPAQPAAAPKAASRGAATPRVATSRRSTRAAARSAVRPAAPEAKAGEGEEAAPRSRSRDPFVSPITERTAKGSSCTSGRKCLSANDMVLKGIVRYSGGYCAMVQNPHDEKVYFLHVNDPVLNGVVRRIGAREVIFEENSKDRWGHAVHNEVVRKLVVPEP